MSDVDISIELINCKKIKLDQEKEELDKIKRGLDDDLDYLKYIKAIKENNLFNGTEWWYWFDGGTNYHIIESFGQYGELKSEFELPKFFYMNDKNQKIKYSLDDRNSIKSIKFKKLNDLIKFAKDLGFKIRIYEVMRHIKLHKNLISNLNKMIKDGIAL